ncbi:hypothetical protein DAPPUDRAFT_264954 [Daphnia pulex]|uniref:Uncharacterized protein n=1 Tax=Daphnia pulex TaxID=6669 RepID=E9HSL8_DAPPU|nr:hypothetical protein DAPPUDRAFT_264954 [Daphnia pulex]|eukprot:EFX65252.1 hypothetical protein DAPPUDRAFT_264954 [Daphnia pulex]
MGDACEEEEEGLGQAMGGEEEVGIEDKVEQNEEGGEFKLEYVATEIIINYLLLTYYTTTSM